MEEKNKESVKEPKKMSYKELLDIANQLSMQVNQLHGELHKSNMINIFKRLEFLFKVLDHKEAFSEKFFNDSAKEIEKIMTIPEENKNEEA